MVKTVSSVQYSVFRRAFSLVTLRRFYSLGLKQVCLILFFLNTEYWTLNTGHTSDLGTRGLTYPIEEADPIQIIQQKLKAMEESGKLEHHNRELQKKAKASVERPKPVPGITRATKVRTFYYDPIYVVKEDLKGHLSRIIYKKGTRINPLETVSLSQNLLFFDSDDVDQKAWAIEKLKEKSAKLILVKGAPLALSEELKIPVYFDQGGLLTQKLGIHHVPAIVTQESLQLRVVEVNLKQEEAQ